MVSDVGLRVVSCQIPKCSDSLQGYSSVLDLLIRWDHGELGWHDPETGHHIATFHQERARADTAEARVDAEQTRANTAEAQVNAEQTRADTAEARVRELEEELRRRQEP